jgi:hypothetical protein
VVKGGVEMLVYSYDSVDIEEDQTAKNEEPEGIPSELALNSGKRNSSQ